MSSKPRDRAGSFRAASDCQGADPVYRNDTSSKTIRRVTERSRSQYRSCRAPATSAAVARSRGCHHQGVCAHTRPANSTAFLSTNAEGRYLPDAIFVDASDKLLVFLTRCDVEPTNSVGKPALRPMQRLSMLPQSVRGFSRCSLAADRLINGRRTSFHTSQRCRRRLLCHAAIHIRTVNPAVAERATAAPAIPAAGDTSSRIASLCPRWFTAASPRVSEMGSAGIRPEKQDRSFASGTRADRSTRKEPSHSMARLSCGSASSILPSPRSVGRRSLPHCQRTTPSEILRTKLKPVIPASAQAICARTDIVMRRRCQ